MDGRTERWMQKDAGDFGRNEARNRMSRVEISTRIPTRDQQGLQLETDDGAAGRDRSQGKVF